MADEGFKRKLAAILSADVEGYSRLMDDDEEATVRTLTAYRTAIDDLAQQFHGRIVDTPGDNILAEFTSVVDCVNCAVEIQRELAEKNAELPDNRRMDFRIGVNLGDVIEEEGRIYGDGVNIAARVESLAEAGGICISGRAHDQVENKLELEYEDLGKHQVKNISRPIQVYRVLSYPGAAAHRVVQAKEPLGKKWRKIAISAAVVVVIAVGLGIWQFYGRRPAIEPASIEKMAFPLPEKPSIAVLPFDNLSGDPDQEFFSDGLTEEIIAGLSKVPDLFVIARNSSFIYKGKPVKVQQVSEELGVRYVLEGSVRKEESRVRITVQLIDAVSGHHMWSKRYDRELDKIFDLQDEIMRDLLVEMRVQLTEGVQIRVWHQSWFGKKKVNLDAYWKTMQARWHFFRMDPAGFAMAKQLCEEAIEIDPNWYAPYAYLSLINQRNLPLAEKYARKTLQLNDSAPISYITMGQIYLMKKQWDKAIAMGERALELDPNGAEVHNHFAHFLHQAGRFQEAIPLHEKAFRLDPYPPSFYYYRLGIAYFDVGRYEDAVDVCKKGLERNPRDVYARIILIAGLIGQGHEDEARAEAQKVLNILPKYSIKQAKARSTQKNKQALNKFYEAMAKAGFPEHPPLPLPDKPSIAVLAFDNLSGDPEQEYFGDVISENIITALSKVGELFVIARNSSFTYKGKPVKVQQVGRELGVRYVLEGSVQKSGDRVRITAQLIDAINGQHIWAENYDRNLEDIFEIQDEVTKKIVTAMRVNLTEGEQARLHEKQTENLDVLLKYAQFYALARDGTKESMMRRGEVAQEIIDIEPDNSLGYRLMGYYHRNLVDFGVSPKENLEKALMFGKKALEMDESDGFAHALLGRIYSGIGKHQKAIESGKRSVELQPNGAIVHYFYAKTLYCAGHVDEALTYSKRAIRLNPFPAHYYYQVLGRAYNNKGEYENALKEFKKALQRAPESPWSHFDLAYTYIFLGRDEEARASAAKCMELAPYITVGRVSKDLSSCKVDKAFYNSMLDATRKAGFPE